VIEAAGTYVGQVERDPDGLLWAVLYHMGSVITREQVRSLRMGKRRVADLVLAAADNVPDRPKNPAPSRRHGLVEQRAPSAPKVDITSH
jgi:hypothetical protein